MQITISIWPRDECAYVGPGLLRLTAACAVPPCFFTFMREATHSIQLRSAVHLLRIADLAPPIGSLLSLAGYSSSSSLEGLCHLYECSIAETLKRCKSLVPARGTTTLWLRSISFGPMRCNKA